MLTATIISAMSQDSKSHSVHSLRISGNRGFSQTHIKQHNSYMKYEVFNAVKKTWIVMLRTVTPCYLATDRWLQQVFRRNLSPPCVTTKHSNPNNYRTHNTANHSPNSCPITGSNSLYNITTFLHEIQSTQADFTHGTQLTQP
jgi:hypothetical protein